MWQKKEYSCFDFMVHSMFTFEEFRGSLVQVSSGTQFQTQIIFDPDYLPDYLSISYDYELTINETME